MGKFSIKGMISKTIDVVSIINPFTRPIGIASKVITGKTPGEIFTEKTDFNIDELRKEAKLNPRKVINKIRDDRNNFFKHSSQDEVFLLETECHLNLYEKEKDEDNIIEAWTCCAQALQTEKNDIKSEATALYKRIVRDYNFKSIILGTNRAKRQCIMVVADIKNCSHNQNLLLLTDECIPHEFIFPQGHYQYNQPYVCHPRRDNTYVDFKKVPNIFIEEKIMELCRILTSLGAKKITIESAKGSELINSFFNNFNLGIQAEDENISGDIKVDTHYGKTNTGKSNSSKAYTLESNPYNKPFFPTDIIWYKNDFKMEEFAKMRLQGNNKLYHERISSSDVSSISKEFSIDMNAHLQDLSRKLGIDLHYDQNSMKYNQFEEVWEIHAEFKSLSDF